MPEDLPPEAELITITEAAYLAGVDRSTVYAWIKPGVRGRCLAVWRFRGKLHTTREALAPFREPRQRAIDRALRRLQTLRSRLAGHAAPAGPSVPNRMP